MKTDIWCKLYIYDATVDNRAPITSSVAEGSLEEHNILHWQNDALMLVSVTSISAGIAGVPMQSITIRSENDCLKVSHSFQNTKQLHHGGNMYLLHILVELLFQE